MAPLVTRMLLALTLLMPAAQAYAYAADYVPASSVSAVAPSAPATIADTTGEAPPAATLSGPQLLVHFRSSATAAERADALASVGAVKLSEIADLGITRVALDGMTPDAWSNVPAVAAALASHPAVDWAEQDTAVKLALTPNDTYWLIDPITGLGQWGPRKIQADRAWDVVRGSANVTVAVIDTGIDPNHPDLQSAIVPGTAFVSQPSPDCAPIQGNRDDNSHGTHVAGIIAAAGDNAQGIAGIAFGVKIMPIKALDCTGAGTVGDIAQGILYAVNNGVRVISLSFGAPIDSATLHAAVQTAVSRNVLVIAAAGNCGAGGSSCGSVNEISYPAAYPESLAVAATSTDDTKASFSTVGSYVGISAPGVHIISTVPTYSTYLSQRGLSTTYAALSGTSQATPHVAGVAALVLSKEPGLTVAQLTARLESTANDLGTPGLDPSFGSGRLNAFNAVTATAPTTTPLPTMTPGTTAPPPVTTPLPATMPAPTPIAAPRYGATYDLSSVPTSAAYASTATVTVKVTNSSNFTWSAGGNAAVRLSYHWTDPVGGTVVADGLRTSFASSIAPGTAVALATQVLAPPSMSIYQLRFDLYQDGIGYFSAQGVPTGNVFVTVNNGYAATYTVDASASATLALVAPASLRVTIANTGGRTWPAAGANPVRLSYHWIRPDGTTYLWDGQRALLTSDVLPGQSAVLSLAVLPPATVGQYTLRLDLVQEGLTWFSGQSVAPKDVTFSVTNGLGAAWTSTNPLPSVLPGGRATAPITVRNDGIVTWSAAGATPVRLSAHVIDLLGRTVIWDGPRTLLVADVPPGQSFQGVVNVNAPLEPGRYRVRVDLVQEGVTWFSGQGVAVAELPFTVAADYRASLVLGSSSISTATHTVPVTVTNLSSVPWTIDGIAPVSLAAHWYDGAGNVLAWDGPRTALTAALAPNQSITMTVDLGAPPPGAAQVAVDLVTDGVRWFGAGSTRPVTLTP